MFVGLAVYTLIELCKGLDYAHKPLVRYDRAGNETTSSERTYRR